MTAPLHQTGALSILHSNNGTSTGGDEMIFLAGRFKAILAYERRMFPKIRVPMYTGARLCTLSSFPSSSGTSGHSDITGGSSSVEMIVAGGEYNGHGSLELYPSYAINNNVTRSVPDSMEKRYLPAFTGAHPQLKRYNHGVVNPDLNNHLQSDMQHGIVTSNLTTIPKATPAEIVRNRQSASRSKILSVDASQGTRIITGDADGIIRWVERDGRQEVRRYDIFGNDSEDEDDQPLHSLRGGGGGSRWCDGNAGYHSRPDGTMRSEVVRKIIAFGNSDGVSGAGGATQAGIVVWTGERLGILSVGHQRAKKAREPAIGELAIVDGEEVSVEIDQAARYEMEMRKALERQGDELRIIRGFGMM